MSSVGEVATLLDMALAKVNHGLGILALACQQLEEAGRLVGAAGGDSERLERIAAALAAASQQAPLVGCPAETARDDLAGYMTNAGMPVHTQLTRWSSTVQNPV